MNKRQRAQLEKALLAELAKHGIVTAACKRAGLSTAQYYRWYAKNKAFWERADEALWLGKQEANDLARSRLLQKIDQGESWAIRFQLSRRDPEYKLPPERTGVMVASDKDALVAASHELLASAVAAGDMNAAKFILERMDVNLMRPKDQMLLKDIESRKEIKARMEETGRMLSKLCGIEDPAEVA